MSDRSSAQTTSLRQHKHLRQQQQQQKMVGESGNEIPIRHLVMGKPPKNKRQIDQVRGLNS